MANPLSLGLYDIAGKLVPFDKYGDVLVNGTCIVATCFMQSVTYQKKVFVQLVPTKIRVIGAENGCETDFIEDLF